MANGSSLDRSPNSVGIIGAGTMGAGIAQVAATAGWTVELADVDEATVRAAIEGVSKRLDRLVEKGRLGAGERDEAADRLRVAAGPASFRASGLVLEAVVEDFDTKVGVLRSIIPAVAKSAIIATNTSALSISRLGEAIGEARRTVGMHFFNPAPLMKLVEVIAGAKTDGAVVDRVCAIAESWGKTTARAADVPGFIVNHVARPYYLEALRILEEGLATVVEIDEALRDLGGFRMGPLQLIDLIGHDVNAATTRRVWEALERPPLLRPSRLQERLLALGHLGRKSGRGLYCYEGETPEPAVEAERRPLPLTDALRGAVDDFVGRATDRSGNDRQRYAFARVVVAIMVQAALACGRGVAGKADIDTALKHGTNYPKGPFEWAEQVGFDVCARLLEALNDTVTDDRFAVPALLEANV
ncbi:MAG: 3-hydroxyacyl-CoA dehydrogenase NAD-binding domain-containing protein [Planctomycetota bacterium]|jgi:3-hydroxybutyryl-CoA dehydrogenase